MIFTFTILGEPHTKKNSSKVIHVWDAARKQQRHVVLPSDDYEKYEKMVRAQTPPALRLMLRTPVNIQAIYYRSTRHRVDLTNLNSALMDALQAAGVIADDNRNIAAGNDGSRVYYDKNNPRTEITITPMEDYEQWKPKSSSKSPRRAASNGSAAMKSER